MYNSRTIATTDLINFMIMTINKIPDPTRSNGVIHWKVSAIQESMEMLNELPWKSWKKDFMPDMHRLRIEAIDVILVCLRIMVSIGTTSCIKISSPVGKIEWNMGLERMVYSIIKYITELKSGDNPDWVRISLISKYLVKIAEFSNDEEFQAYAISKTILFKSRLDTNGKYPINYNKITDSGLSEDDMLQQCINAYISNPLMTIQQLMNLVEAQSKQFKNGI